jgi:hypothetical protein
MRLSRTFALLLFFAAVLPSIAYGEIRTRIGVTIPQRGGGANLTANLYAPDVALGAGPHPVISMLPGGGAGLSSTEWAAQRLARDGYVVCLVLPEASTENSYANASVSGLDFLRRPRMNSRPIATTREPAWRLVARWTLAHEGAGRRCAREMPRRVGQSRRQRKR